MLTDFVHWFFILVEIGKSTTWPEFLFCPSYMMSEYAISATEVAKERRVRYQCKTTHVNTTVFNRIYECIYSVEMNWLDSS